MTEIVPRTCTEIRDSAEHGASGLPVESRPLEQFRDEPAYVLLGDPGAGKSTSFARECAALGNNAVSVPPRDLIHFEVSDHPEWVGKTLFIDGLDEVRAGAADAHTPFDSIRKKLDALGKPRFRLSCRQADWLGSNDLQNLKTVAPGGKVTLLQLDRLTQIDVATILQSDPRVEDADSFIQQAVRRNIEGMLFNPQSLDLLVAAVAEEDWPASRLETFARACWRLAAEQNPEHALAAPLLPPERLLAAAGRLGATLLLTGTSGFALNSSGANADYLDPSHCIPDDPEAGRQAVQTRLFTADGDRRFSFVHRHIAEFLGARYLAGIVEAGLPVRRVLALIAGADGAVVTPLRGLSAWLAAHCPRSRGELIERDPIGVGLYGDLGAFTFAERHALLQSLAIATPDQLSPHQAAAFAPLAAPELESMFGETLTDADPSERHQQLVYFLLQVLKEGAPLVGLAPVCLDIVRDDRRPPHVNAAALDVFCRCQSSADLAEMPRRLLADIVAGRVSDPYRDLLGRILTFLYPRDLPPTKIWDYAFERDEHDSLYLGSYFGFWEYELLRKSSDEQVCKLLDECRERIGPVRSALESHSADRVLANLVAHGLSVCGDELHAARLYDWLGIGLPEEGLAANGEGTENIRAWLSERPDVQKAVVLEGLRRSPDTDAFHVNASRVGERLYRAELPGDFESWCLQQALSLYKESPRSSEFLLRQALVMGGLDPATVRIRLSGNRHLTELANLILAPSAESPEIVKLRRQSERHDAEQQRREDDWLDSLRTQESALRENRAAPSLLHQLAQKFFGSFLDFSPEKGNERIAELVRHEPELMDAVSVGLQAVIDRENVPDFGEILRLHRQRRMHYLGLPFLAGLAIAESTSALNVSDWTPEKRRKALAFYLTFPHGDYEPRWYRHLVERHPDAVADAQIALAAPALRKGPKAQYHLWHLAHDESYDKVARRVSLPLLQAFPTRCRSELLVVLDQLLWAAVAYGDRSALEETIARKLAGRSMNPLQRAHWLAAGCVIAPETYRKSTVNFVTQGRGEERVRHILALFCSEHGVKFSLGDLDISTVKLLVRLGGTSFGPQAWSQAGIVDMPMRASELVWKLIQRLAQDPSSGAGAALRALVTDRSLSRWRPAIEAAINEQRVVWRDLSYRIPSLDQVLETFSGRNPSSSGDLAALTQETLRAIGRRIRTTHTDDWRQYWNDGEDHQPDRPKHEHLCRDALLSDLRNELPRAVDAQPEGDYAEDRRADIRIAFDDYQVPVEIKKNAHRDLWSAPRNQLIEHYTTDPATGGYGIYAVFWFGANQTQLPPSGRRPATPEDLENRLLDTLSAEERRKVSVCVIDVSRP